jgi:uncharacterized membrane protein YdjX (TVP38/TMEM64 family)
VTRPRALRAALLGALVLAGFVAVRRALGLELDPASLQDAVADLGIWGPLVYVGIVAFRVPLGLPSGLVLVGGGLAFGTLTATICGAIGLTLSAIVYFLAARFTGRASIEARLPERMKPVLELAGTRFGALFVSAVTAYPFGPVTLFCLLAGVTGMTLAAFVAAVFVGSLGRAALYTYFGSRLVEDGMRGLAEASVLLALAIALPLIIPWTRRWLLGVLRAARGPEPGPPSDTNSR